MALILEIGIVVLVLLALGTGGGLLWLWLYRRAYTPEQREQVLATYRKVQTDLHERYDRAKRGEY